MLHIIHFLAEFWNTAKVRKQQAIFSVLLSLFLFPEYDGTNKKSSMV